MAKDQPAAKFRFGYVTATVWKNEDFFNPCCPSPTRTAMGGRTGSVPATF
jgi:hypothetical protein